MFLYLVENFYHEVPAAEGIVGHKHVALGAPGVRSVTLLQYHNFFLNMAVRKVNP